MSERGTDDDAPSGDAPAATPQRRRPSGDATAAMPQRRTTSFDRPGAAGAASEHSRTAERGPEQRQRPQTKRHSPERGDVKVEEMERIDEVDIGKQRADTTRSKELSLREGEERAARVAASGAPIRSQHDP